jgi:hypothetical protein
MIISFKKNEKLISSDEYVGNKLLSLHTFSKNGQVANIS